MAQEQSALNNMTAQDQSADNNMTAQDQSADSARNRRGFTLIELMVVVVILGSLIALVGPNVWNMLFTSRQEVAKTQMSNFGTAISSFKLTQKRLPNSLDELTEPPEGVPEPFMSEIPDDPWGTPFEYKTVGKGRYQIISAGEDKEIGTDDDVKWPLEKDRR